MAPAPPRNMVSEMGLNNWWLLRVERRNSSSCPQNLPCHRLRWRSLPPPPQPAPYAEAAFSTHRWWWIPCNTIKREIKYWSCAEALILWSARNSAEIPIDFCPAPAETSSSLKATCITPASPLQPQREDWSLMYFKNLPFHLMAGPGLSRSHLKPWLDQAAQFKPAVI